MGDPLRGLPAPLVAVEQDDDPAADEAFGPLGPPRTLPGKCDGRQPERARRHGIGFSFNDPGRVLLERLGCRKEVARTARLGEQLRSVRAAVGVRLVPEQVDERAM